MNREVKHSKVFAQQHTGISISSLESGKKLAGYQDDKYFVPASNTKLFSFYAGLCALGDSIPGLEYLEWGELLIIRGTGDPSLLHPDLPHSKVLDFLKSRKEPMFFTPFNFENKRFGPGWAWSDYNDYYQPEVTSMPVFGNIARFKGEKTGWKASPHFWQKALVADTITAGIERDELQNVFHYSIAGIKPGGVRDVPVHMTDQLTLQLLGDTLKKEIKLINIPLDVELQRVNSIPSDSLYRRMMQVSDNMLAEQLMLVYASASGLPLSTEKAIKHAIEHHLSDLPDKPVWKDGSGLSRYNLFTPRSIVALLQKINAKMPRERLFYILPNGGKSGSTLGNLFKGGEPFVFAKTGSLSNVYNLSGYLVTKKGKTLAFSFMNNNFTRPSSDVRKEIERILTGIRDRF